MATVIETTECYPKPLIFGHVTFPAPEVAHERCPGGHTFPGRMGGWVCPCPCHRNAHIDGQADG